MLDFSLSLILFTCISVGVIRGNTQHKCLKRFGGTWHEMLNGFCLSVLASSFSISFLILSPIMKAVDETYRVLKDKGVYILVIFSYHFLFLCVYVC